MAVIMCWQKIQELCGYSWGELAGYSPNYRQTPNKRRTKSQNLHVCRLVLQLYLHNPLKPPDFKSRMKM